MMVATDLHLECASIPVKMDLRPLHNGRVQCNHTTWWRAGPSGNGAVPCRDLLLLSHLENQALSGSSSAISLGHAGSIRLSPQTEEEEAMQRELLLKASEPL